MHRLRVIPVLLLQEGELVKSVRFRDHQYVGDPINAVRIFNEKEVDEIIILDISATKAKREPNLNQIAELAGEAFMPFAYGGGVTSLEQASEIFYQGAEKVILNASALQNSDLITQIARRFGSQSVVVSIDVAKPLLGRPKVYGDRGTQKTKWDPVAFAKHVEECGAGEVMLTSIDRDGTFKGYDTPLVSTVANALSIPLIACGGASSLKDFQQAASGGAAAVSAGSFFVFQMPHRAVLISYPDQADLKTQVFSRL